MGLEREREGPLILWGLSFLCAYVECIFFSNNEFHADSRLNLGGLFLWGPTCHWRVQFTVFNIDFTENQVVRVENVMALSQKVSQNLYLFWENYYYFYLFWNQNYYYSEKDKYF